MQTMFAIKFGASDEITEAKYPNKSYELSKVGWIPFGRDNLFPERFMDMLSTNGIYNRVMSSLSSAILGNGLSFESDNKNQINIAQEIFDKIGINEKFLEKCAWDLAILNTVCFEIVNGVGRNGMQPASVNHIQARLVRVAKDYENPGYFLSGDWSVVDQLGRVNSYIKNIDKQKYKPVFVDKYSTEVDKGLIYDFIYSPAMVHYPLPQSEPSLKSINALTSIIDYQVSLTVNSINSSMVIKIPRRPNANTEKELQERYTISQQIQEQLAGAMNAGKAIILFYDAVENGMQAEIETAPNSDLENKYIETVRLLNENIFTSLGVISSELFGVSASGGFSSQADMLLTANEIFIANTVKPLRKLLTNNLDMILTLSNVDAKTKFINSQPIQRDVTIDELDAGVLSIDEYRQRKWGV